MSSCHNMLVSREILKKFHNSVRRIMVLRQCVHLFPRFFFSEFQPIHLAILVMDNEFPNYSSYAQSRGKKVGISASESVETLIKSIFTFYSGQLHLHLLTNTRSVVMELTSNEQLQCQIRKDSVHAFPNLASRQRYISAI